MYSLGIKPMTLTLLAPVNLQYFSLAKLLSANQGLCCCILPHVRMQDACIDKIMTYQDVKSHGHMRPDMGLVGVDENSAYLSLGRESSSADGPTKTCC